MRKKKSRIEACFRSFPLFHSIMTSLQNLHNFGHRTLVNYYKYRCCLETKVISFVETNQSISTVICTHENVGKNEQLATWITQEKREYYN